MITRRSTLAGLASTPLLWKNQAMAADWTAERFEAHIVAVFDDIESKAKIAGTISEIDSLQDRLDKEWYGAKPGAFLPADVFERLNTRLGEVGKLLTERFVALKQAVPAETKQITIIIERGRPTPDTFFYAPHYSNKDQSFSEADREAAIRAAELRLGIALPQLLRGLYARQNGGHTDFWLASMQPDPEYEFRSDDSEIVSQAYDVWLTALPGMDVVPLETLKTLGVFSDGIDFGDQQDSWRNYLPEIDRLIPISNYGSDIWLCLDYREGRQEPKIVLFNDTSGDRSGENIFAFEAPDFATFFSQLRRHAVTIENGQRMRGMRSLNEAE